MTGVIRLETDTCWQFLTGRHLGRVALVLLGQPTVFPVNYAVDGRSVVFRSAPGTKLALAAAGTRVAFEVDEVTPALESGTSVVVHGVMHEVVDQVELERLRALPLRSWAPGGRDHFIRIEPDSVSGRAIASAATGEVVDGG